MQTLTKFSSHPVSLIQIGLELEPSGDRSIDLGGEMIRKKDPRHPGDRTTKTVEVQIFPSLTDPKNLGQFL